MLDRKVGEEIGAKSQVVLLSAETLKKQNEHHPELTQKDYEKAQEAVIQGEKSVQDSRNIAFVRDSKDGIVVIVNATLLGDEMYVTSLYKLSSKDPKRKDEIRRLSKK